MNKEKIKMKVKHWQGYGSLNMKVIEKSKDRVVIEVWGNHEYGIEVGPGDKYRVCEWLLNKVKGFKDATEEMIESYQEQFSVQRDEGEGIDVDHNIYTINLKRKEA